MVEYGESSTVITYRQFTRQVVVTEGRSKRGAWTEPRTVQVRIIRTELIGICQELIAEDEERGYGRLFK
jgi:hypothetical protein